jgi:hypothetical protein
MTTVRVSNVSGGVLFVVGTALSTLALRKFISYDASRREPLVSAQRRDVSA